MKAAMYTISIVSDFVCPWCYIGTRRLSTAIALVQAEQQDFQAATRWLPFFLNPDTPPEGEPYLPFLERKFGSRARVEEIFQYVRSAAATYGLDYAFEKITLRANTLPAHRLIQFVQKTGPADAVVERLFQAQFQRGEYVGDIDLLCQIASDGGFDIAATRSYLGSDDGRAELLENARHWRTAGINMVPTFILPEGRMIVGAEDPHVLAEAILDSLRK